MHNFFADYGTASSCTDYLMAQHCLFKVNELLNIYSGNFNTIYNRDLRTDLFQ